MVVYEIFKKDRASCDSLELVELKLWKKESLAILRNIYLASTKKYSLSFLLVKAI